MSKKLDHTKVEDVKNSTPDLVVFGDSDVWRLLCKASSENQGWMKSTKLLDTPLGTVIQVTTEFREFETEEVTACAEALTFVPGLHYDFDKQTWGVG
jgi:hypothetical protein